MHCPISISGTGCSLVDQIYPDINFSSEPVSRYMSRAKGDGGLHLSGTFLEEEPGEELNLIKSYYQSYIQQIND